MGRLIADLVREDTTLTLPLEGTGENVVIRYASRTMQVHTEVYGHPTVMKRGGEVAVTRSRFRRYLEEGQAFMIGPDDSSSGRRFFIFLGKVVDGVFCIIMHRIVTDLNGPGHLA